MFDKSLNLFLVAASIQFVSCIEADLSTDSKSIPFSNNISSVDELAGQYSCYKSKALGSTKFGDCVPLNEYLNVSITGDRISVQNETDCSIEADGRLEYDSLSNMFVVRNPDGFPVGGYSYRKDGENRFMQKRESIYECGYQCEMSPASAAKRCPG